MENQDQTSTTLCSNCKRDIPSINYVMHQNHCQRNIKLCEHCKEPVPTSEMEAHFEEEHKKVPCDCKELIEKCNLEEHKAKHCTQRSMKCEYCEIDLPFAKITEHKDFCGSRTELCPKCKRYIQMKDQDVHDISDCNLPAMQSQPKSKLSNTILPHMGDHYDGLEAALFSTGGWQGSWENDVGIPSYPSHMDHRSASDVYDLTSPIWYGNTAPSHQTPASRTRRKKEDNQPDRKHRKNQDRVQNSFGVAGKKKTQGSGSMGNSVSRPWEKNDKTQQNLSQEESDRLLAMHLAQDLQDGGVGRGLDPVEHHLASFNSHRDVSKHNIEHILKDAYDIPAANVYQEENIKTSSVIDVTDSTSTDSSMLPCEFCQQPFSADELIQHESGCHPDIAGLPTNYSANNNRQHSSLSSTVTPNVLDNLGHDMTSPDWLLPSHDNSVSEKKSSSSVDTEEDCIMLPCEFCGDLLPSEFLSHHQVNCTENSAPIPSSLSKNHNRFNPGSPVRPRPRRIPAPNSLDLTQHSVKHQEDPTVDVLMVSPDSKPIKDETRSRHAGLPKSRKSKVTSTVTRPGVKLAGIPAPGDKYLNGRPYDRDASNGGMVAKPRVVTVERKGRSERSHSKPSSSRGQRTHIDLTDLPSNDFDDDVLPLYTSKITGKQTKNSAHAPTSPSVISLNNKPKQDGHLRSKPLRNASSEGAVYEPSFGVVSNERRRASRDKNIPHNNKPSTRTKHSSANVVNLDGDDDDLIPLRLNRSSKQSTGGAKPKQKKHNKKPDDDIV